MWKLIVGRKALWMISWLSKSLNTTKHFRLQVMCLYCWAVEDWSQYRVRTAILVAFDGLHHLSFNDKCFEVFCVSYTIPATWCLLITYGWGREVPIFVSWESAGSVDRKKLFWISLSVKDHLGAIDIFFVQKPMCLGNDSLSWAFLAAQFVDSKALKFWAPKYCLTALATFALYFIESAMLSCVRFLSPIKHKKLLQVFATNR